jgi:phosphoenolpyruvate-protein kinase (PTS system EI component)
LDVYVKQVNELPREEATARRVSAVKLQRDYDRVFSQYQAIIKDHSSIRVDRSIPTNSGHNETFSNAYDNSNTGQSNYQHQQQTMMHELVDVDDAIIEEREQDIRKINQDLHIVNEMFRFDSRLFSPPLLPFV